MAAPAPAIETAATDERAELLASIKATWQRVRPFASLDGAAREAFGVAKLADVSTDDLRKVLAALEPSNPQQPAKPRRPSVTYHQTLAAMRALMRVPGYPLRKILFAEGRVSMHSVRKDNIGQGAVLFHPVLNQARIRSLKSLCHCAAWRTPKLPLPN